MLLYLHEFALAPHHSAAVTWRLLGAMLALQGAVIPQYSDFWNLWHLETRGITLNTTPCTILCQLYSFCPLQKWKIRGFSADSEVLKQSLEKERLLHLEGFEFRKLMTETLSFHLYIFHLRSWKSLKNGNAAKVHNSFVMHRRDIQEWFLPSHDSQSLWWLLKDPQRCCSGFWQENKINRNYSWQPQNTADEF